MSDRLEYNGQPIDNLSQVFLQVLRDRGGRATAGELRRVTEVEDNQQVHYRMKRYLVPAGLVEGAGTRAMPGRTLDARVYGLTDEGREWLNGHAEDILQAVEAAEAMESLQRVRTTVDTFGGRLERVERRQGEVDEQMGRWSSQLHDWKGTVEDVREMAKSAARASFVDDLVDDVRALERETANASEDRRKLNEEIADVEGGTDELDARMAEQEDVEELVKTVTALEREVEGLEEELEVVRVEAERGFWDRLFG